MFLGGKGGRCVGLTALPPSCADCLEILGTSTSWSPKGLSRPVEGQLYPFFAGKSIKKPSADESAQVTYENVGIRRG